LTTGCSGRRVRAAAEPEPVRAFHGVRREARRKSATSPGFTMGIDGISHITFISTDLERTAKLLCLGLGAKEVYDSSAKNFSISREKFFTLGGVWLAVMEGEPVDRSYRHVAFKVDAAELPAFEGKLRSLGVEIKPSRPRVDGEGQSLYFYDFDNNLFELHTGTLEQRLQRYGR
jgi:catechol 2,3-dioxygenase-like lactoylglutathione lyase family enzyme